MLCPACLSVGLSHMDDFYESQEYQEIVADARDDALLEYGRPGGEVGGAGLFVGILQTSIIVGTVLKRNSQD